MGVNARYPIRFLVVCRELQHFKIDIDVPQKEYLTFAKIDVLSCARLVGLERKHVICTHHHIRLLPAFNMCFIL